MKKRFLSLVLMLTLISTLFLNLFAINVYAIGSYGVNLNSVGYTSINPFAQCDYTGECTWYCWGRAYEKCGVSLPCREHARYWKDTSGYPTDQTPSANSIAVWTSGSHGHVAFVESYSDGNLFLSESNISYNNVPIHIYSEGHINLSSGYYTNTFTDYSTSLGDWNGRGKPDYYIHLGTPPPQAQGANIGDDFYAYIIVEKNWIHLTANSNNVELSMQNSDTDPKQIWHFIRKNNYNQYEIINEYDGKALDVGSTELCTNVQTYQRNNTTGQLWVVQYVPSGTGQVTIHPVSNTDMAVDVYNAGFSGGTNIQLYSKNGTQAQSFKIYNLATNSYNYYVPKPVAPTITSAFLYGNMLNLKWTESPQINMFDNDRRYEVYIYDSNNTLIHSANAGDKTEYSYFMPEQGTYYVRVVAASYAYNTSYVPAYQASDKVTFTVGIEACASFTNENNGNVYLLFDSYRDYKGAKEYCESLGGHLATITSEEEQELVNSLCENGKNKYYWLGGDDEAQEGIWNWITGEKWSYTNWDSDEPNNYGGTENYLMYVKSTSNWNDGTSSSRAGFICEIENETILSSKKKEIKVNGNTYILFEQSLPWTEAKKYCEYIGGHLVTISSRDENDTVLSLIVEGSKEGYRIGATNEINDTWTWVTGENIEYANWNLGEPNNSLGIEKYAEIFVSGGKDGLWNDVSNYINIKSYGFICEIEKGKPATKTTVTKKSTYTMLNITPENTDVGTNIIVAMYNEGKLADIQIEEYTGEDISIATFVKYDEIKVMLWDSLSTLKPLGNVENIKG